jgi:hypothetical protein
VPRTRSASPAAARPKPSPPTVSPPSSPVTPPASSANSSPRPTRPTWHPHPARRSSPATATSPATSTNSTTTPPWKRAPIATGAIEGACRHLIADRLDITGARWGLHGAEAVLKLRTITSNGHLNAYFTYHTAREHERLYSTPDQATSD